MFREALRVKSGCLRCRTRKKKCDEKKPACSYCARWNLECCWPSFSTGRPRSGRTLPQRAVESVFPTSDAEHNSHEESSLSIVRIGAATLNPFEELPVPIAKHRPHVTRYLHYYFTNMISGALPFDVQSVRVDLARGWMRSAFADFAVCYAFAAYAASLQSQSLSGVQQGQHSLEFETQALTALRRRLGARTQPNETTVLVAALHVVILALNNPNVRELRRVSEGVGAMIVACGGYARVFRRMSLSTVQSVVLCDTFCSILSGDRPLYHFKECPLRPSSFDGLCTNTFRHPELEHRCDAEVLSAMRDMDF